MVVVVFHVVEEDLLVQPGLLIEEENPGLEVVDLSQHWGGGSVIEVCCHGLPRAWSRSKVAFFRCISSRALFSLASRSSGERQVPISARYSSSNVVKMTSLRLTEVWGGRS